MAEAKEALNLRREAVRAALAAGTTWERSADSPRRERKRGYRSRLVIYYSNPSGKRKEKLGIRWGDTEDASREAIGTWIDEQTLELTAAGCEVKGVGRVHCVSV